MKIVETEDNAGKTIGFVLLTEDNDFVLKFDDLASAKQATETMKIKEFLEMEDFTTSERMGYALLFTKKNAERAMKQLQTA